MSYLEEDFDPVTRHDPRRDMPGVLDSSVEYSQLNTISFTNVDHRTDKLRWCNRDWTFVGKSTTDGSTASHPV